MKAGRIFAVVGPSGAGKDTLIAAARAARPGLHFVRRVITRPRSTGGEDFESVTGEEFARRVGAGEFALTWDAHGLRYGIPASVAAVLATGQSAVFNGSRAAIREARARFVSLRVIVVTAGPATLAARLDARGRETALEIEARLTRAGNRAPEGPDVFTVANDGTLDQTLAAFLAILDTESS